MAIFQAFTIDGFLHISSYFSHHVIRLVKALGFACRVDSPAELQIRSSLSSRKFQTWRYQNRNDYPAMENHHFQLEIHLQRVYFPLLGYVSLPECNISNREKRENHRLKCAPLVDMWSISRRVTKVLKFSERSIIHSSTALSLVPRSCDSFDLLSGLQLISPIVQTHEGLTIPVFGLKKTSLVLAWKTWGSE